MTSEIYTKKEVESLECCSSCHRISSISDILRNFKEPRKVFKGIIFLFFLGGFIYQVHTFLDIVDEYPTVVSMDIKTIGEYILPTYTICSSIKVSRKKYCEKYKDRCLPTDEEFCKKHKIYCEENDMRVKEEYTLDVNQEDVDDLKFNYSDSIIKSDLYPEDYEPTFSVPRSRFNSSEMHHSYCFALHSLVESQLEPNSVFYFADDDPSWTPHKFIFDPQMNDVFEPDVPPGIFLAVHSPYDAVNPFARGYFLSPRKHYIINVYIREVERLSSPYDTDCTNYEEEWRKNNFKGVRSKQMCRQKCYVEYYAECYNCSDLLYEYPSQVKKICSSKEIAKKDVTYECRKRDLESCDKNCKEECSKTIFRTNIMERPIILSSSPSGDKLGYISVDVEVFDDNIMHYEYVPKYEDIEVYRWIY